MSELFICPICRAYNYFKQESTKERKCHMWGCSHKFTLKDKLYGLRYTSKKSFVKLALEADIKKRTFQGFCNGSHHPSKENMEKLEVLFKKYFSETKNDFVAE